MSTRLLLTADLHQQPDKWQQLVQAAVTEQPDFILVAGDLLPKIGGPREQQDYFPQLRRHLDTIRQQTGASVLTYMVNDFG